MLVLKTRLGLQNDDSSITAQMHRLVIGPLVCKCTKNLLSLLHLIYNCVFECYYVSSFGGLCYRMNKVYSYVGISYFCLYIMLTLKVPITTAADDIHKFFFYCFSEKIRLDVSSESSARQRIHLKHQALFSSKDKSKKLECRLLQFLFSALRVEENC